MIKEEEAGEVKDEDERGEDDDEELIAVALDDESIELELEGITLELLKLVLAAAEELLAGILLEADELREVSTLEVLFVNDIFSCVRIPLQKEGFLKFLKERWIFFLEK